ncbi:MAG TPA: hypothetical protein VLB44_00655 [Kofleriaceae bacterium]|nr:hypothetical protein [Kofleriaceae bacterium]
MALNAMNTKTLLAVCILVACGKGDKKQDDGKGSAAAPAVPGDAAAAATPDPACAAKVKDFEGWLTSLELERSSYEIDFGYRLQVIGRAPSPVEQKIDAVEITPSSIEAFDASESNHAESKLGKNPAQKALLERLTTIHGMANDAPDRVRIDVDEKAPWGDVARVADAAQKAGYKEAVLAFTATSKLTPPAGVEAWTSKQEEVDAASKRIEEMQKQCKAWDSAILTHVPKPSREDNAKANASEIAAALVKCNCAVDLDEVRTQMFKEARWHQAVPRVGVLVQLADGGTTINQPAKTLWSDAHKKLLDAAAEGAPPPAIKLAAK